MHATITLESLESELARQNATLAELRPQLDALDPDTRVVLGGDLEQQLERVKAQLSPTPRLPVGQFIRI